MKPFLAMIVPALSGGRPDHELPKPPTGGGSPGRPDHTLPGDLPRPEHPIWYPLPPGAPIDPEYGLPVGGEKPDQGLPGRPDQGLPGRPDQGLPPVAGRPPQPDQGLPKPPDAPTHPIQPPSGGVPTHPIVLPPDAESGWGPVYIWGGGPGARPPIALPPDSEGPPEAPGKVVWKALWTPTTGWVTVGVIVPGGEHVTPSKRK